MIKDIGIEGLKADIKAEYDQATIEACNDLKRDCVDLVIVSLEVLGVYKVIKFLFGISTESTGPK